MTSRVQVSVSGADRRDVRIRHVTLTGPADHPGYGVVDELATLGDSPDLVLLHRFCSHALGRRAEGFALRRAHLGRATEQYDTGRRTGRYQRLGVRRSPNLELYRKHWRIAKMRYACQACRYYTGSH